MEPLPFIRALFFLILFSLGLLLHTIYVRLLPKKMFDKHVRSRDKYTLFWFISYRQCHWGVLVWDNYFVLYIRTIKKLIIYLLLPIFMVFIAFNWYKNQRSDVKAFTNQANEEVIETKLLQDTIVKQILILITLLFLALVFWL